MTIGPVQLVVLGFSEPEFKGEILAELDRLKESDVVRVIDALGVFKDSAGEVSALRASNLSEEQAVEFGAVVGALIGFGAAGEEGAEAGSLVGAASMEGGGVPTRTRSGTWSTRSRRIRPQLSCSSSIDGPFRSATPSTRPAGSPSPMDLSTPWISWRSGCSHGRRPPCSAPPPTRSSNRRHQKEEDMFGPGRRVARRTARRTSRRMAARQAPPPAGPAPAPAGAPDYAAELQQLAALRQQGILTEEEFDAKKKQILGL